jgi:hypothetical protein
LKNKAVILSKYCPDHGNFQALLEENAEYYLSKYKFDKPGNIFQPQTPRMNGCPFDCGLCPDHEQHTCIGLIEITQECDLKCPVCYADGGTGSNLDLSTIEKMLDFFQTSENNQAEILQISGGEPTTHPQIIDIIKLARSKKIKYIMVNTNGIRIANDLEFVKALAVFKGEFEIYLQFDGFNPKINHYFRGQDLLETKLRAIKNLMAYEIPITLVSTIENGINDQEIGQIIDFGLKKNYIRGINFQPTAYFGRYSVLKDPMNRITISGIINRIEKQSNQMIQNRDFVPLPCNVHRVAVSYFYRKDNSFIPVLRNLDITEYTSLVKNTLDFDAKEMFLDIGRNLFSGNFCNCFKGIKFHRAIKQILPSKLIVKSKKQRIEYVNESTFRISITSFLDKYNFETTSAKKECVHVITPDLKKIPFSTYNMLYRGNYNARK